MDIFHQNDSCSRMLSIRRRYLVTQLVKLMSTYQGPIKKAIKLIIGSQGESGGGGGGGHVVSLIQEGGFQKLLCDFMGGREKRSWFKKKLSAPRPAVYIMNAALQERMSSLGSSKCVVTGVVFSWHYFYATDIGDDRTFQDFQDP